jgi:hypothetical protein
MKSKLIASAFALAASFGVCNAQTTVIELTGATAFRSAAIDSINAAFLAGSGNGNFATGYSNTTSSGSAASFGNGSMQIWRGTFPGITGTTIIRTSWNGSVEGIRAVASPGTDSVTGDENNPLYLKESILGGNGTSTPVRFHSDPGGAGAAANLLNYERAESDFAFSDVAQSATPVSGLSLSGGPVGVVVFTMIANKTWSDDVKSGLIDVSNITAQQFRSMAQQGYLPLSSFTGNASDTAKVYLTGRNDGSGTRTSYLSETGVGAATPIQQYVGYDRSVAGSLPSIYLVPANGGFDAQGVAKTAYRSTVWGNSLDGNGGHVSSSDVRTDLSKTTASTEVYEFLDSNEDGEITSNEASLLSAAAKLYMISYVTYDDARSARGTGLASDRNAEVLGYEGVRLEQLAGDSPAERLSDAGASEDLAKVANGVYTPWNFQQLYYVASRDGAATVFNELKTRLNSASVIGRAGLPIGSMNVNRTIDGGVITPGAPQ